MVEPTTNPRPTKTQEEPKDLKEEEAGGITDEIESFKKQHPAAHSPPSSEITLRHDTNPTMGGSPNNPNDQEDSHPLTRPKKRPLSFTTTTHGEKSKKPKLTKKQKKLLNQPVTDLRRIIQQACGTNNLEMALEAYQTFHVQKGVRMEPQSYQHLLNLCEGNLGERIHIGTPKPSRTTTSPPQRDDGGSSSREEESGDAQHHPQHPKEQDVSDPSNGKHYSLQERKELAFQIKQKMEEQKIPFTATAYVGLIRLLCKVGDVSAAEQLLEPAEKCQHFKPRVRMYACVMNAYCAHHQLAHALRVWIRMVQRKRTSSEGVHLTSLEPTEKEYCALMKCATRLGDSKVMEYVLTRLGEEVMVPSMESTKAIIDWFQSDHAIRSNGSNREDLVENDTTSKLLSELPSHEGAFLGPVQYFTSRKDSAVVVSQNVGLERSSGRLTSGCLKGEKLKPVPLTQKAWNQMMEMNEYIVLKGELEDHAKLSKYAGGKKGLKRPMTEKLMKRREEEWSKFITFLKNSVGLSPIDHERVNCPNNSKNEKIDIVIDGANVGYYRSVYTDAPQSVDYRQIDSVVNHFLRRKKRVLLFLHQRHFEEPLLPPYAKDIVQKWNKEQVLYRTPFGFNDDWFWMHAALWSGRDTLVISNDEMRDHHFQMLAHRYFLHWKERHQIHFERGEDNRLIFHHPLCYSRRIQRLGDHGIVIPLPKRGDENRFLDGSHTANDSAPSEDTFICINLQTFN